MLPAQYVPIQFQFPFGITENTINNFERNLTKPTVIGPLKELDEEVVFYDVEVRGTKRRYLVWRSPSGVKAVMGENGSCCDSGALACLSKERDLFGDDRLNISFAQHITFLRTYLHYPDLSWDLRPNPVQEKTTQKCV